jgi:histone deacetylase 6
VLYAQTDIDLAMEMPPAADLQGLASPLRETAPGVPRLDDEIAMAVSPETSNENMTATSEEGDYSAEYSDADSSVEIEEVAAVVQGLTVSTLPTGLIYDERMRYHSEVSATTGDNVHPEDPRRIYYIYRELCQAGLVDTGKSEDLISGQPLLPIPAREATREEIELVHAAPRHYEFVKATSTMTDEQLIDLSEHASMDSIYFNALSFFSGKLSAGGAIEACREVFSREKVKNAIAVIRPPGHHAEVDQTMGFCLFNNVCIASRVCQEEFGEACRKILILDWDVHHGNGCQKAFYDDPNILYISLHVHMDGKFYPSTQDGAMDKVGEGMGIGKNVNIPWPTKGMGDGDYMYAFQNVVMPIAIEFNPDLVVVAAGFDAAAGDELGGCFVTPPCYAHMTHMLMSLADGKVAVCLEGGYNFQAISKSALAVTRTLMGEPPDRLEATRATDRAVDTVEKVRAIQAKYWRCIGPKEPVYDLDPGEPLHDLLRQAQARKLYDRFRMTKLHVLGRDLSPSFDDQILATPDYDTKKTLLVIFHDPPDVKLKSGRTSNLSEPHTSSVVDGVMSYVGWAVSQGYGVIDVNVPAMITPFGEDAASQVEYSSTETDVARLEGERLIRYLYTNYIEPNENTHIMLMGVGNSFHAIARLLTESEDVYQCISGVIGFIALNPVRPVGNNSFIQSWYRQNSLIYVAETHGLWKKAKDGKISKRYGNISSTPGNSGHDIMLHNKNAVRDWIKEKVRDDDETEEVSEEELQSEATLPSQGFQMSATVSEDVDMNMGRQTF